ncbi:MAG: hypothetical protein L6R43_02830 [Planctomycetes bacterium]|nr:hypothetical protein [Planctomycetota bacterium]
MRYPHYRKFPGGAKAAEPLVLWAWSRYPETVVDPSFLYIRVVQKALGLEEDPWVYYLFRSLAIAMALTPVPTPQEVEEAVAAIRARGLTREEWDEYRRDEDAGKPELGPEHFPKKPATGKRGRREPVPADPPSASGPELPRAA